MAYTIDEPEIGMLVYKSRAPQLPGKVMEITTKGKTRVLVKFINGKEEEVMVKYLLLFEPHVNAMAEKVARHQERLEKVRLL